MADSNSPAIELTGLSLSFGDVRVLKNLNLRVERGQYAALTGRSGAGKTSLLAIIAGLLKSGGGRAMTLGRDVNALDEDELAALRRAHIGVVFQHFHLIETMTALENAALTLELSGRADAQKTAAAVLDSVGLGARMHHFPSQLSGGECQRVAIARAFAIRPRLLLADEPTGNLDDETGEAVLKTLFKLGREHNTTVLLVTHNTSILPMFDKIWHMRDGGVRAAQA